MLANRLPSGREFNLEVTQDYERIETRGHNVIAPDWVYLDAEGHRHDETLDTAEWVVIDTYWCGQCHDMHDNSELRCRECGETLEPRYEWVSGETVEVPKLTSGTLTVVDGRITTTYLLTDPVVVGPGGFTDEWLDSVIETTPVLGWGIT